MYCNSQAWKEKRKKRKADEKAHLVNKTEYLCRSMMYSILSVG